MTVRGIVSGSLFKAPVEKTSKVGRNYIIAKIREGNGDAARWFQAFVFSESTCEEFRRLTDGDPIAVAGDIDAEVYAPEGGEPRVSWKIVVDKVLTARKPKREQHADG